ncbi:MAG: L-threonylcarbamoyladenylate synthase [Syntrophothermus sp.]
MANRQGSKKTRIVRINPLQPEKKLIDEAAAVLREGGTVAFPTETVYGLGANALDPAAVRGIFAAKGRPADNPLIAHLASRKTLGELVGEVPPPVEERLNLLIDRFWPGPLTLILPRKPVVPDVVTGGLETVAVRMPDHPVALALIAAAGVPVAAPSANTSGRPSPTTADHVAADLDGKVDMIIDGGPTGVGVESTVLDLTTQVPTLLRPGGVTYEELKALLGGVDLDQGLLSQGLLSQGLLSRAHNDHKDEGHFRPRSPGMKYTHYAPRARVILVEGPDVEAIARAVAGVAQKLVGAGQRVGIMATYESEAFYRRRFAGERAGIAPEPVIRSAGTRQDSGTIAATLFKLLREFDTSGVDVIIAEGIPATGLGFAVMNRLRKAASEIVEATSLS